MPIPGQKTVEPLRAFWKSKEGSIRLYRGDALSVLRRMTSGSVHCVVTSPPYHAMRSYLEEGHLEKAFEIGAEKVLDCLGWAGGGRCGECYVCHLTLLFHELRIVLRDDGVFFLNLSDGYLKGHLKGIPWRVALSLQADGWGLVSEMPWVKRDALPDSAQRRPGKALETFFMFTKSPECFFDMQAVRSETRQFRNSDLWFSSISAPHGLVGMGKEARREDEMESGRVFEQYELVGLDVTKKGYRGAHYAVFPPSLLRPLIRAGTSERGCCSQCGAPLRRVLEKEEGDQIKGDTGYKRDRSFRDSRNGVDSTLDSIRHVYRTVGWKTGCECESGETKGSSWQTVGVVPCTVLDPFMGSGTTAAVCIEEGRKCIGIELSEKYLRENAIPRIEKAMKEKTEGGENRAGRGK